MALEFTAMEPDEILHWLDRFGIPYKVHKGAFVTAASIMLQEGKQSMPRLRLSIAEHADALAELVKTRQPAQCAWCHAPIKHGDRTVRVYAQEEGRRYSFHEPCHAQRAEKLPHLPMPDILFDDAGLTVLVEDSGLCAFCNMAEAELPEETPNACQRCWKKQEARRSANAA